MSVELKVIALYVIFDLFVGKWLINNCITNLPKCDLSQSLVGIYLHGSLAMGFFPPQQSDIDILIIV
ncbi:nucleotidyltransferase domain-containing protein [Paenibacillus sp. UNC217MF]|uniref:Nucleotidyltransferase domain-containing protein n=2 Tax=Paenibacillus alvei TaxID=44250 RepID=A0ABT4EI13_PAEAL|nr:nucleotidyltransferase domain-containing protein [Paenibacillus sp. UNC217MF]MCY9533355.1 nucleotidyltransferase domain-containing protein [Paenibacillus alvei]